MKPRERKEMKEKGNEAKKVKGETKKKKSE